jgi:hypothetical protein
MPALNPIPPAALRHVLEAAGHQILTEDDYNWLMARVPADIPLVVPHRVRLIPVDVLMDILDEAGINNREFFRLLDAAGLLSALTTTPE